MPSPRRRPLGTRHAYPNLPQVLELRVGPRFGHSLFATEAARKESWDAHGAVVLGRMDAAQRPSCWALRTFGPPPNWTPEDAQAADAAAAAADAERQRRRLIAEEFGGEP